MRLLLRSAGAVVVSLFAAVVLTLFTVMPSALAGTLLAVGGIGQPTLPDWVMSTILKGRFAKDTREDVPWPAEAAPTTKGTHNLGESVEIGKNNLIAMIADVEGPLTVVGMSGGALVTTEALRYFANNPGAAPDPEDVTFIVIADSSRQEFINKSDSNSRLGYHYQPAPETPFDVIVVTGEYDGFADFPDRWWNLTAVMNAYAGVITGHIQSAYADLSKVAPKDITVEVNSKGGTTTSYLVRAEQLPLTVLLPFLKPYEASLKKTIDKGYSRNDASNAKAVAARSTAAPVEAAAEEEPAKVAVVEESDTEVVQTSGRDEEAVSEEDDESARPADEESGEDNEEAALAEAEAADEDSSEAESSELSGDSSGSETAADESDDSAGTESGEAASSSGDGESGSE
ncbi:MAG: PE-PPE domain-containing protein [Mycolicibacterium sp.]|uniref:PE-PPE domain-containing protein n=1 Tax=Mycolicibacterium sp. TaxID=2320850 RepID=UPI003D0B9DE0